MEVIIVYQGNDYANYIKFYFIEEDSIIVFYTK